MFPSPTSAAPRTVFGVEFVCWRTSIGVTRWKSADERLTAFQNEGRSTYTATVDGKALATAQGKPRRFLSITAAMEAAVQHARMNP